MQAFRFPSDVMRRLATVPAVLSFFFVSCARDLPEDSTAMIETAQMRIQYGCEEWYASYFSAEDSAVEIQSFLNDFINDLESKGNDLDVVSTNARFTISIRYVQLYETLYESTVADPCDTTGNHQLSYTLSDLEGSMTVIITDNYSGRTQTIHAEASTSEDIKDHPTIFQSMIGRDSCYTPSVRRAYPEMMKNRLLRRAYRKTMNAMQSMLR
jgi:hypothetical protein